MKKIDLLRTARADFMQVPPPEQVLNDDEAQKRLEMHGIVFAGRYAPDGSASGFGTNGAHALQELASLLWKEDDCFQVGTEGGRFRRAVVDAVTTDFRTRGNAPIETGQDDSLEKTLRAWFDSQTVSRTFFIPCAILPDRAAAFNVGPVAFMHLQDFIAKESLTHARDVSVSSFAYGPLLDAMRERSASWLAQVDIHGRDKLLAIETSDLAVDIALVAIQMAIPVSYSRGVARITGRTFPAWTGQLSKSAGQISSSVIRQDPGHGFSAHAFNVFMSDQAATVVSIGNRVAAFVTRQCHCPRLEQAWTDAAYWFHEGLVEPLDAVATAKYETALEVLLGAESAKGSNSRLLEAFEAFYSLTKTDCINPHSSLTVGRFVKQLVEARSRILHGTLSTLSKTDSVQDARTLRLSSEWLAMDLLRQASLLLDRYVREAAAPADEAAAFLAWIKTGFCR